MLAMGGAPVLGFDIGAHNLAKHRASLHPTDGRAGMEVQAAASSAEPVDEPPAETPAPEPSKAGKPFIPAQQV